MTIQYSPTVRKGMFNSLADLLRETRYVVFLDGTFHGEYTGRVPSDLPKGTWRYVRSGGAFQSGWQRLWELGWEPIGDEAAVPKELRTQMLLLI